VLNAFARPVNPLLPRIRSAGYGGYYWVVDQAEVATDVMFTNRRQLLSVWPDLVHHAALNMGSDDVLGFLGRKLQPRAAEVCTDAKGRRERRWCPMRKAWPTSGATTRSVSPPIAAT
jgi:hypothetical protein